MIVENRRIVLAIGNGVRMATQTSE